MSRLCPACHEATHQRICCGVRLAAPFRMNKPRVMALRRYAHGRKGLDEDTYRLHLAAVGAGSTVALTRAQFGALMCRLGALPDRARRPASTLTGARA